MGDLRKKDTNWNIDFSKELDYTGATLATLMDIRDELKQLNCTMGCFRVQRMADAMIRMDRRLAKTAKLRCAS